MYMYMYIRELLHVSIAKTFFYPAATGTYCSFSFLENTKRRYEDTVVKPPPDETVETVSASHKGKNKMIQS